MKIVVSGFVCAVLCLSLLFNWKAQASALSASPAGCQLLDQKATLDPPRYNFVFPADGAISTFISELNSVGAEGYRLKSVIFGYQDLSGGSYAVPVAILQSDEAKFEYTSFEGTAFNTFGVGDFEKQYQPQAKKGFTLVNYFQTVTSCADDSAEPGVPTIPFCQTTHLFLLEREQGRNSPTEFFVAETFPKAKRNMGEKLTGGLTEKLADGFYPVKVLSNYQVLLARRTEKDDFPTEQLEVQVLTPSFMNGTKGKIETLSQQGFRVAVFDEECAVMYRLRGTQQPVSYEWLRPGKKNFGRELKRVEESGALYRMLYIDPWGGYQLVFEREADNTRQRREYKTLTLSFQLLNADRIKESQHLKQRRPEPQLDLTPESRQTLELINNLSKEGFVVRDVFITSIRSKSVGVLLERAVK